MSAVVGILRPELRSPRPADAVVRSDHALQHRSYHGYNSPAFTNPLSAKQKPHYPTGRRRWIRIVSANWRCNVENSYILHAPVSNQAVLTLPVVCALDSADAPISLEEPLRCAIHLVIQTVIHVVVHRFYSCWIRSRKIAVGRVHASSSIPPNTFTNMRYLSSKHHLCISVVCFFVSIPSFSAVPFALRGPSVDPPNSVWGEGGYFDDVYPWHGVRRESMFSPVTSAGAAPFAVSVSHGYRLGKSSSSLPLRGVEWG